MACVILVTWLSCVQVEPKYLTMTNHHVVAASDELVYVWQFRTSFSKILSTDVAGVKRKDVREKVFHVDNPNPAQVRGPPGHTWPVPFLVIHKPHLVTAEMYASGFC